MGNIKVEKPDRDFEMVPGIISRDMDALTVGVYVKLLTFGNDWTMNVNGLAKTLHLSVEKIRKSLITLESNGFIKRSPAQDEGGKLNGWEYTILGVQVKEDERTCADPSHRITEKPYYEKSRITGKPVLREKPYCEDSRTTENPEGNIYKPINNIQTYIDNIQTIKDNTGEDVETVFDCQGEVVPPPMSMSKDKTSIPPAPLPSDVEEIYLAYPSKDLPTDKYPNGRSLGKSKADRIKIAKLLQKGEYSKDYLLRAITRYIADHPRGYMQNFSVFLNHIPEIDEEETTVIPPQEDEAKKLKRLKGLI